MPIQVQLEDGIAEFPDSMQPSEIQDVLQKRFPKALQATVNQDLTQQYLRTGGQKPESGMESGTEFTEALYQGWKTPIAKVLPDVPGPLRRSMQSQGTGAQRGLGTYEGVADTLNSLTSPENLALLVGTAGAGSVSKLLPPLIGMAFGAQMGKNISVDLANKLGEQFALPPEQRDQAEISKLITQGIAETAMVGGLAVGAKRSATEKGVPDASQVTTEQTSVPSGIGGRGGIDLRLSETSQRLSSALREGNADDLQHILTSAPMGPAELGRLATLLPKEELSALQALGDSSLRGRSVSEAAQEAIAVFNRQKGTSKSATQVPSDENAPQPRTEERITQEDLQREGKSVSSTEAAQQERKLSYASPIREAKTFYESLSPFTREGEGQVPIEEGGPGVQPQGQTAQALPEVLTPEPPQASVHLTGQPSAERPLGIVSPSLPVEIGTAEALSSPVKSFGATLKDFWGGFSMQAMPKTTRLNRESGEAGARYAASPYVARTKGQLFAERAVGDNKSADFDTKLGTALSEDNLRSIRQELQKANDPAADRVATLVGNKNSPFKTEQEYQDFLNSPEAQAAIARHKQLWDEEKDPIFRTANDLDPETELPPRGLQTGARVNLKAVMEGEGTKTTVGPASRPTLIRQTATLLRRDPFARKAKGTGQSYEGSYSEIMQHAYEREYPVAAQHDYINNLLESGLGKITEQEHPKGYTIGGEPAKAYLMRLRPWAGRFLQIPKSIAHEYEVVSGLTPSSQIPFYTKAGEFLTKQSIVGLAEGSTHSANLMQHLFTGIGPTANPMLNALLKATGRADLVVTIPRAIIQGLGDRRADMLKLAEIAAAKPTPYKGLLGGLINRIDQGVRLNASSVYNRLADASVVEKTETGLREYINQMGNYNKRLQPSIIRWLRDTQVQPFATAHQTFLSAGLREMALDPGVKATSTANALALRTEKAAGILGLMAIVGTLNYVLNKNVFGPKGTELGSVGWIGDDGKVHQFSVSKLSGIDRGLRQTGIKGAIEAKRLGLPLGRQSQAGAQGAAGTAVQTVAGPINQFLSKAITGQRPGVPFVQEAPIVPPQAPDNLNPLKTQIAKNIETAIKQANPAVDAILSAREGKTLQEIAQRQLSRYTPRTGPSQETIAALPKIAQTQDVKAYAGYLATQARKLPLSQRQSFVMRKMKEDGARPQDQQAILTEVKRKGVFKFK